MEQQDTSINSTNEEFDAEWLVWEALELIELSMEIENNEIFRLLQPLSTEEKLIVWEVTENKIKEFQVREIDKFDEDEIKIEKEIYKLSLFKKSIIFYLLEDSENGLLDMLAIKLFPGMKLWSSSIREPLNITIYPKHWTWLYIEENKITLNIIKEIYEELEIGWGNPEEVIKQIKKISNATLAIQEQIKSLKDLKPENDMVIFSLRHYKEKVERLLWSIDEVNSTYKKDCIRRISELKYS